MKLRASMEVFAGGEGSGPKAPCSECGPKRRGSRIVPGPLSERRDQKELRVWRDTYIRHVRHTGKYGSFEEYLKALAPHKAARLLELSRKNQGIK